MLYINTYQKRLIIYEKKVKYVLLKFTRIIAIHNFMDHFYIMFIVSMSTQKLIFNYVNNWSLKILYTRCERFNQ